MKGRVVGLSALGGSAVLVAAQVAYVSLRDLPLADGFDPSGRFGDSRLPLLRLALVGDSSITGQGLDSADECWARLVAAHLSDRFYVELRSYGVGGARSWQALDQQVPLAERRDHDVVIVSVGSNDILRMTPPWRLERNLDEIVGRMQQVAGSVILFGVGDLGSIPRIPWPVDRIAAGAGHVADWVQARVADKRGAAKVNQWELTTEAFNTGPEMFAPDMFHPSPQGQRVWADAVIPTVEAEIERLALGRQTCSSDPAPPPTRHDLSDSSAR